PNGMDGVSGLNQRAIPPGKTFKYEFTLRQSGTFMYHPHFDEMVQIGMGMQGVFVMHPRGAGAPRVDRDFAIMLNEWTIKPGTNKSDTTEPSDFNVLTFNSKVFPGTGPLVAKLGQRVRIRLANLSALDHHPIHLHGYQFRIAATDGGRIAEQHRDGRREGAVRPDRHGRHVHGPQGPRRHHQLRRSRLVRASGRHGCGAGEGGRAARGRHSRADVHDAYRRNTMKLLGVAIMVLVPIVALGHEARLHRGKPTEGEVASVQGDHLSLKTAAGSVPVTL